MMGSGVTGACLVLGAARGEEGRFLHGNLGCSAGS